MMRAVQVAILAFACVAAGSLHAQDPAKASEAKQAERKLADVRAQIRQLGEELKSTSGERSEASDSLGQLETAISAALEGIGQLDAELAAQTAELETLDQRRQQLTKTLGRQREALAVLLRSAYALGHNEELKLLLQQEDVGAIARVLAYHRYFQRARVERIDGLLVDLKQLADVQAEIAGKQQQLAGLRSQREAEVAALESGRGERQALLQAIDARIDAQKARLALQAEIAGKQQQLAGLRSQREAEVAALESGRGERQALLQAIDARIDAQKARLALMSRDEKNLLELLERLRDLFADIPKTLDGSEPFARLRGRLVRPLPGKVRTAFGGTDESGRSISGVLIAAESGTPVKAVARGRVAFADWLKGYGMLMILDHGDGYMSLYGYNESLRNRRRLHRLPRPRAT
jgi:septal ring factor EnvC (AmiA/AmiB activator)